MHTISLGPRNNLILQMILAMNVMYLSTRDHLHHRPLKTLDPHIWTIRASNIVLQYTIPIINGRRICRDCHYGDEYL